MKRAIGLVAIALSLPFVAYAAPANDDFLSGTEMGDPVWSHTVDTTGASLEPDEPIAGCGTYGATVWYHFTSGYAGTYGMSTAGSDYDTVVAIWRGNHFSNLDLQACNDNTSDASTSYAEFSTPGFFSFYIQVGGVAGATGNLVLELTGPPPPPPYGSITGRVTDTYGVGIWGLCIEAADSAGTIYSGSFTDSNGEYGFSVWPGTWRVHFKSCVEPSAYPDEWYDNEPDMLSAARIEVASNQIVSGIDAILGDGLKFDLAITHMRIENDPVGTDGVTLIGWRRFVHVRIRNRSPDGAGGYPTLTVCPETYGSCAVIGQQELVLGPGASRTLTFEWDGLRPPMIGNVHVTVAILTSPFAANPGENYKTVDHYVLVRGLGAGYSLEPCGIADCPDPIR